MASKYVEHVITALIFQLIQIIQILSIIQIMPKTSTNVMQYLYFRGQAEATSWIEV